MFEQSGTFKNEWKKLGYEAYDYDLQNNFGETNYQIDLFKQIELGWGGRKSIFDDIKKNDLIMAFFPCIYFESMQQTYYSMDARNIRHLEPKDQYKVVIKRVKNRYKFYDKLWKLYALCDTRGLRLIIENPANQPHYLLFTQNFIPPTFIDRNRALRGDYFLKPTAYWFVNLTPTYGKSYQVNPLIVKRCKPAKEAGTCSEERSLLSSTYAKNFICDFVLGKRLDYTMPDLFSDASEAVQTKQTNKDK